MASDKVQETGNSNEKSGKKRRWKTQGGGRPNKKQRKVTYVREAQLHKGKNLILCSCQKYKEKVCGRDLKLQMEEFIKQYLAEKNGDKESEEKPKEEVQEGDDENENEDDDLKKDTKSDGDSTKQESISEAIAREKKEEKENAVCQWFQMEAGGLVILEIYAPVKASDLLVWIFEKSTPKRPPITCWAFKLFPCDCTSFSNQEQLIKMCGEVIGKEDWSTIPDDHPYAIDYRNRGNKSLNRNEIYKGIGEFVDSKYSVNLKDPKTVLLLQTFSKNAGFSILRDGMYAKHRQFNLTRFEE